MTFTKFTLNLLLNNSLIYNIILIILFISKVEESKERIVQYYSLGRIKKLNKIKIFELSYPSSIFVVNLSFLKKVLTKLRNMCINDLLHYIEFYEKANE